MLPLRALLSEVNQAVENNSKALQAVYGRIGSINKDAEVITNNLNNLQVNQIALTKQRVLDLSSRLIGITTSIRRSDHLTDNQKYQLEKDRFVVETNVSQTTAKLDALSKAIQSPETPPQIAYAFARSPVMNLAALTEPRLLALTLTGLYTQIYTEAQKIAEERRQLLVTKAFEFSKRISDKKLLVLTVQNFCERNLDLTKEIKGLFSTFQATVQSTLEAAQADLSQAPSSTESDDDLFDDSPQDSSSALPNYEMLHRYVQSFQASHNELSCNVLLEALTGEDKRQKLLARKQLELKEEKRSERIEQFYDRAEQVNRDAAAFMHKKVQLQADQNGCVIS